MVWRSSGEGGGPVPTRVCRAALAGKPAAKQTSPRVILIRLAASSRRNRACHSALRAVKSSGVALRPVFISFSTVCRKTRADSHAEMAATSCQRAASWANQADCTANTVSCICRRASNPAPSKRARVRAASASRRPKSSRRYSTARTAVAWTRRKLSGPVAAGEYHWSLPPRTSLTRTGQ